MAPPIQSSPHRVVVVGGGFGGLQACLKLARLPVDGDQVRAALPKSDDVERFGTGRKRGNRKVRLHEAVIIRHRRKPMPGIGFGRLLAWDLLWI